MHPALQGRLDPADVLQEAFLQAAAELSRYLAEPKMPFDLWLRTIVLQKVKELHRHHLGVQARDAGRELRLEGYELAEAQVQDAGGRPPSPGEAAVAAEARARLRRALDRLEPADREVLSLRYFEQRSNRETALALGISETAASNRHVRALLRLKELLRP